MPDVDHRLLRAGRPAKPPLLRRAQLSAIGRVGMGGRRARDDDTG